MYSGSNFLIAKPCFFVLSATLSLFAIVPSVAEGGGPVLRGRLALNARSTTVVMPRRAAIRRTAVGTRLAAGATLVGDAFSESSTPSNAWLAFGGACLTAGSSATPPTSVPACGSNAPQDANGQGALQLTAGAAGQAGMIFSTKPVSLGNGLRITFTDYAFGAAASTGDGVALLLTDASQPLPAGIGGIAGSLGYANGQTPGLVAGYLGIAFDESGQYSSTGDGRLGGPGTIPESIAIRGAASLGYPYLGGATDATGTPASLPFTFEQPGATRPANAPTVAVTLLPSGTLGVTIDLHDGRGEVTYYSGSVAGIAGQPAVPAQVYVGVAATTDAAYATHQIGNLHVAALNPPNSGFVPTQIANLAAWYDASQSATILASGGAVGTWQDASPAHNDLAAPTPALAPRYGTTTLAGLPSVHFGGSDYLLGLNASFSTNLFNESTVFLVSNQSAVTQNSSPIWSGNYGGNPRYSLRLSDGGVTRFDFNASTTRISTATVPTGPAVWTASGSVSGLALYLRKNGNTLASASGATALATGNYPLALGAMTAGGLVSYKYVGDIGEVLVFARALSATETATVEGYLACKWGLQNRLPANHPFRTICPQGGGTPNPVPSASPASSALINPPELASRNGSLVFNVTATQDPTTLAPQFSYGGSNVPPTLRVSPGDTLVVNLVNALPVPPSGAGYANTANLHYHGLHVSPNAPGDDSIDLLAAPGQTLHYQFRIPDDHPTGLFWYHSHAHGEAERQNLAGMSGALVVEGIASSVPQVANLPERILIVRDAPLPGVPLPGANRVQVAAMRWAMAHGAHRAMHSMVMSTMGAAVRGRTTVATRNPFVRIDPRFKRFAVPLVTTSTHCTTTEAPAKILTVNGQTTPTIGIRTGEKQFWRLVNAGSDTYLDVQADGTNLQIVALDGYPVLSNGVSSPFTVSHYVVPPSSRIEFIITGPKPATSVQLRTNCFDAGSSGMAMPAATLAYFNAKSSPTDLIAARSRTATTYRRNARAASVRSLLSVPVSVKQTLYYSDQNTIDGAAYDPAAPSLLYAQNGTVQEWTVINNASQVHTFHIHQLHFALEAVNGVSQNRRLVLDNVNVPAATATGPGSVKVLLDFTDPTIVGTFLLHCHILSHEDAGMMAKITVGLAPPMKTSASTLHFTGPYAPAQNVAFSGGIGPYSVSGCASVATGTLGGRGNLTVAPIGGGSCVIVLADSTGVTSEIVVTVDPPAPGVTVAPNVMSFGGIGAAAQTATIFGGTQPYGTAGCTGIATPTIVQNTVSLSPAGVGTCTLTIADAASVTTTLAVTVNATTTGGAPADNLTFHHDAARSGWYSDESTLGVSTVASSSFGLRASLTAPAGLPAFGKVYAQPLYVSQQRTSDGATHNLVIIATSTDQIYAFDDTTRALVWHTDFTNAAAGVRQQRYTDTGCADISPDVGITGTPVVDRVLGEMFVVVPTVESATGAHLRLHALSLATGLDAQAPQEVTGSVALVTGGVAAVDPLKNNTRGALLEANGNIYVPLASHCDYSAAATHGWVVAYTANGLTPAANIVDVTNADTGGNYFLGSVWMSGYGPAADAFGNIYFATGNGAFNGSTSLAMSVVRVPGNLDLSKGSSFTPASWQADSLADADLGSGGVMLLPDKPGAYPHLLVQGGKGGATGNQKYLLNRDQLGGVQAGDAGALWHANTGGPTWGGPAYFEDNTGQAYVVYGGSPNLNTYALALTPPTLAVQSTAYVVCLECRDGGSQPVISSNGTQPGSAVAWALKTPGNPGGTISLYAFDALQMSHTLFSGVAGGWTQVPGTPWIGGALVSPTVANGHVYVPTDGSVAVFGLN